jgi:hypothetical protein
MLPRDLKLSSLILQIYELKGILKFHHDQYERRNLLYQPLDISLALGLQNLEAEPYHHV